MNTESLARKILTNHYQLLYQANEAQEAGEGYVWARRIADYGTIEKVREEYLIELSKMIKTISDCANFAGSSLIELVDLSREKE